MMMMMILMMMMTIRTTTTSVPQPRLVDADKVPRSLALIPGDFA
jgi:hypothetical protein